MKMSDPFGSPTEPSTPLPSRPPRSIRRASSHSILTTPSLALPDQNTPPVPMTPKPPSIAQNPFTPTTNTTPSTAASGSTATYRSFDSPRTPGTPTAIPLNDSHDAIPSRIVYRKSTSSIRRKPVPTSLDPLDLQVPSLPFPQHPSTTSLSAQNSPINPFSTSREELETLHNPRSRVDSAPPTYILPVDPPSYPPSYPSESNTSIHLHLPNDGRSSFGVDLSDEDHARSNRARDVDMGVEMGMEGRGTVEELPRYTEEMETEPKTLARSLWIWGWLCPLLWAVGMCILWIPLRPIEEEADPEKAQKLEEMIVILRETEMKYAKRCLYAFIGFLSLIALVVVIGVVLSRVL